MVFLLWDASALSKRYGPERGTAIVDTLFSSRFVADMAVAMLGYAETLCVLVRKRNRGEITVDSYIAAKTILRLEILDDPALELLTLDDISVLDGLPFIERHNLNATDAAILTAFLFHIRSQAGERDALLIASDQRLLRAAEAEGLATLNPELVTPDEATAMLAQA